MLGRRRRRCDDDDGLAQMHDDEDYDEAAAQINRDCREAVVVVIVAEMERARGPKNPPVSSPIIV